MPERRPSQRSSKDEPVTMTWSQFMQTIGMERARFTRDYLIPGIFSLTVVERPLGKRSDIITSPSQIKEIRARINRDRFKA